MLRSEANPRQIDAIVLAATERVRQMVVREQIDLSVDGLFGVVAEGMTAHEVFISQEVIVDMVVDVVGRLVSESIVLLCDGGSVEENGDVNIAVWGGSAKQRLERLRRLLGNKVDIADDVLFQIVLVGLPSRSSESTPVQRFGP